jgi:hypothetical protein
MVRLNRQGIPEKILTGKAPKYISVHRAYKSRKIHEIMKRVNRSFWIRANGGTDDLGNSWKPLAPATHAYKPLSPIEKNTYAIDGKVTRGLLTPEQDRVWRGIYARTLKRLQQRGVANPEKEAASKAWAILKAKGARTLISLGRITKINIRTGRLVAATRPGAVANHRYYPPRDQIVEVRPRSIRISFRIPYAKAVDRVRLIVPNNIDKWIIEAHDIAILEAKRVYERIQDNTRRTRRQSQRKSTTRSKRRRN